MVVEDHRKDDQHDPARANQYTPVPAITEQATKEQEQATTEQKEREYRERIADIATRRRRARRSQSAKFYIECFAALATVAIAFLTCAYVRYSAKQWQVMSDQATIMAMELAPNVIANVVWPKPEDYLSLTFTNIGRSTAYNFTIAPKISSRKFDPNFDPFKSLDWSVTGARAIEDLPPGEPTVSTYMVNRPEVREVLYLWGTYSYESRVPGVPKETRRFCYMAQNGGEVWPCKSIHVISLSIGLSAQGGVSASAQTIKPTPATTATPSSTNAK
jgi:hypothetical protein